MLPKISRLQSFFNTFKFVKDPISSINKNLKNLGPTYSLYVGGLKLGIVTIEPEIIQQFLQKNHRNYPKSPMHFDKLAYFLGNGLLTSEGPYWLRQRRLIQPGFHRERLQKLTEIMQLTIEQQLESFEVRLTENGHIDAYQEMMEMAFRVVASSLFSTNITEEELQELIYTITTLQEFIIRQIRQPYLNPWFKLSGRIRKHKQLNNRTDRILKKTIRNRKEGHTQGEDLLQMLLDARYEDTGEAMSPKQLLDECKIIFVAGHETSANALSWTWCLLAQHPEVVHKVRAEIAEQLSGRKPAFKDLPQLTYLTQVIEESMRLYPPAWITDRVALNQDEINGLSIPKGAMVIPYIFGAHRNPEIWEEPEAFRPERFHPDQRKKIPNFAYLPFGGGPRLCIGNNFAIMEMQLILIEMIRRYDFELIPGQDIQKKALITLRPYPGVLMKFEKRY